MAISPAAWASALVTLGCEVEVFTTNANAGGDLQVPIGVPVNRDGIVVTYFPRYAWSGNRFISLQLLNACQKEIPTFDCIHAVGLWTFPSVVASMLANHHRVPYILSLHGDLMEWAYRRHHGRKQFFMELVERRRISTAGAVICSSEFEAQHFRKQGFTGKVKVISNIVRPVDIDLGTARQDFRRQNGLEGTLVLLFAGRLVKNKGLHLTFDAFASVATQFPHVRLVIVGPIEDESYSALQQQLLGLGLENRVLFLGMLSGNPYWQAVAGADLFVLNSYSESFGMAAAEALASGMPVLLSDQVGIASLVQEYRAGMVTPLDVPAIARAMREMLSDNAALVQMGQNGVRLVREHFASHEIGELFFDLIKEVVRANHVVR